MFYYKYKRIILPGERQKIVIDIDKTLLSPFSSELLPGSAQLLYLLSQLPADVVIWTTADPDRWNDLEKALQKAETYPASQALSLLSRSAFYGRGDILPQLPSYLDPTMREKANNVYKTHGIKIPGLIGKAKIIIDDDAELDQYAQKFGFHRIDPTINRPENQNDIIAVQQWANSIIKQINQFLKDD
jgi:hypothetical protein